MFLLKSKNDGLNMVRGLLNGLLCGLGMWVIIIIAIIVIECGGC